MTKTITLEKERAAFTNASLEDLQQARKEWKLYS